MSEAQSDKHTPARWLDLMLEIAQAASLRLALPSEPPYMFDGYEAHETRRGGMGLIIVGRDPQLDRPVALKLWQTAGPEAEAALIEEAKMLAKLSHPNVVTVYGVGRWEDWLYFAMEYVEGEDGEAWIEDASPPIEEILEVFLDAGRGLAAAHDAGIQHRDFKPANMLVGADGRTRVADFGVAERLRSFAGIHDLMPEQVLVGTPAYMAPERLRGERGDARSDQFSFCVALFKALHGQRPFAGHTPEELLGSMAAGVLRVDPEVKVPAWLDRVLRRGLAIDPEQRFADMHELIAELERGDKEEQAPAPTQGGVGLDQRVRLAMVTSVVALVALTLALGVVSLVLMREREVGTELLPETTRSERGVTPEGVIEMIEGGELQEAAELWQTEVRRRTAVDVAVHADSIRIGQAFMKEARRLANDGRVAEAKDAADAAETFGFVAIRDLKRYGQPVDAGARLITEAGNFLAGLRESN